MNVKIPPRFEELIKRKIESGLYQSHDDLIEKALMLLDEYDKQLEQLRKEIAIGIKQADNGQLTPASEVFDELRHRNADMSKRKE